MKRQARPVVIVVVIANYVELFYLPIVAVNMVWKHNNVVVVTAVFVSDIDVADVIMCQLSKVSRPISSLFKSLKNLKKDANVLS